MVPTPSPVVARALAAHEQAPLDRSGAHLADASFRFDASAPPAPSPRPRPGAPGAEWTLAETLQELRLRGVEVVRGTGGLKVRHAHRLPEVVAAVAAHRADVGRWLRLGRPAPTHGWDDAVAFQAAWLRERLTDLPTPLALRPGVSVTDAARFLDSVEGRYADGAAGPAADGLRRDLGDVYARHADTPVRRPVRRAPARAA